MAHRAKHRKAALFRRAEAGRTIKSDLTHEGEPNDEYRAAVYSCKKAKTK